MVEHLRWLAVTIRRTLGYRRALRSWVRPGRDRLRLAAVTGAVAARVLRLPVPVPRWAVAIEGQRHVVAVRDHYELAGAVEVLTTGDYDVDLRDVRRVLDLGANVGFAALLFASRYPDADVVAVEPAPDTFARLVANVEPLRNVRALQLAVGSPGQIRLELATPSTERHAGDGGVLVERVSLDQLLERLGWSDLDLLKIDIEGDEFAVLEQDAVRRARVIIGELHPAAAPRGFTGLRLDDFEVAHPSMSDEAVMFRAVRTTHLAGR
jgi:FkbM family methyltransferase